MNIERLVGRGRTSNHLKAELDAAVAARSRYHIACGVVDQATAECDEAEAEYRDAVDVLVQRHADGDLVRRDDTEHRKVY